jgi:hypothetical protein
MSFTRREILTAFLGLPLAISACKNEPQINSIDGEIVGQNVNLGHILREMRSFEVPADNWETVDVAIIGGGIAGLTSAWKLKREKFNNFILLELEKEAGGTSRNGKNDFISYPWAAHYLPVPFQENKELIEFLDELKLIEGRDKNGEIIVPEQFLCREPEERVFYKGRWYEGLYLHAGESEDDKLQLGEFQKLVDFYVNWRDGKGKRAFVVPVGNCSNDAEILQLDKLNFAEFLRSKGFTSERLFWYCDYACRDDYGLKLEQTSAWAGMFYFCSRVRKSGEESQPFITFPEGNGKYTQYFREVLADKIRTNHAVVKIIPNEKGVDIICLNDNQIRGFHAKKVIYSSPIFTAKYLIENFNENYANEFQHNAWFVANLTLKNRPKSKFVRDFPLSWDNVLYESKSLGYVCATHQKGMDYGETVFTYYYPMCHEEKAREKLFGLNWQEMADIVLTDMSFAHKDIRELTTRIDIMRWGHAMISPRQNFMWSGVREKAMKPFKDIHFAHSDLSGIPIFEEAFYHGLRTAKEILQDKK